VFLADRILPGNNRFRRIKEGTIGDLLPFRPPSEEDGVPTRRCPHCGHSMFRDAVRCRHCKGAVPPGPAPRARGLPWWLLLGALLALAVALGWVFGR